MTFALSSPARLATPLRALVLLTAVAALGTGPVWMDGGTQRMMAEFLIYLALAQLWNLLAGYSGLISIGQQAFVGLGGYALFSFAMLMGVPILLALPLAGAVAALVAFPTALVAFRLSGPHFAIGTWVIAEVFRLIFAQIGALGGGSGTSMPAAIVKTISSDRDTRDDIIYWLVLMTSLLVVGGVWALMRSRIGLGLAAIRDDELAAQSAGVVTTRLKLSVYVIAAGLTGMLGALIFLQKLRISPEAAFSVNDWTVFVIFMVVIGGIGSLEGPILGCLVFFVLREQFADLGTWYMIGLGALSVVVMLFAPKGLWSLVSGRTDFRLFAITRSPPRYDDPGQ
jgi:branched-chain amino acid transport system permease protein